MATRRFWSLRPSSPREAADAVWANLWLHAFPTRVHPSTLAWWPGFWLGTAAGAFFAVLVVSGLPLMVWYVPSVTDAYRSVKDIEFVVPFGWWLRAVHRLAAHAMVVVAALHLARVFVTGSYRGGESAAPNRAWNWVIGIALLAVSVLLSFTGYLLPWDQLAFWAVTVGVRIAASAPVAGSLLERLLLGGRTVGPDALLRFYVLHVVALPAALVVLSGYHMWRIRKDGGLARPSSAEESGAVVPSVPAVPLRVAVVGLASWLLVTALALVVPTPLLDPANPNLAPNPAKAPWYFLWLQEAVADTTVRLGRVHVNGALVGGVLLPVSLVLLLTLWPWLDRSSPAAIGRPFASGRRAQVTVFLVVASTIVMLTVVGLLRGPSWEFYWPWQAWPTVPTRF
jgi:cytochrome b-561